ncbi:hypothetical protein [Clostridium sp.]|uniref:hypothetical protein n=1 Tax=Clostridium sp. TaxID=1506 RepID=UPI002A91BD6C|nr:hypothetical protein [Clostridium sp.]MDY6012793.1 hypothetical protein [Clostridium sp.]
MKKIINVLSIASSIISGIVIICTFITSYQFIYISDIFNSYLAVQISVAITMILWALRFWLNEYGRKKFFHTSISLAIVVALIFFIFGTVR